MVARLLDNCAVRITSTGTGGPLALGDALQIGRQKFLTFAEADAIDGMEYAYKLDDGSGWEVGYGEWNATTNTIARNTYKTHDGLTVSTSPLSLSGRAFLSVVLKASDFATLGGLQDAVEAMSADAAAAAASAAASSASAAAAAASAASVDPTLFLRKAGGETGGALTGPINFARSTVASHATTADIWAAGNQVDFTGTATITDFPDAPQAGAERVLICAGVCTFTNNANIAVQGAANYTAAAGDIITVYAMTLSTFRVTIARANGLGFYRGALGKLLTGTGTTTDPTFQDAPSMPSVLLATLTASNSSSLADTTSLTSTYDLYMIELENVVPATNAVALRLRVSTDVGLSYKSTSYGSDDGATTYIGLGAAVENDTASGGVSGVIFVVRPAGTTHYKKFTGQVSPAPSIATEVAGAWQGDASAVNAIQLTMSSGNITSGKVRIKGIKTS